MFYVTYFFKTNDSLIRLLDIGEYSDFTFYVHGQGIKVHKFILSARSPYFYEAFRRRWIHRTSKRMQGALVRSFKSWFCSQVFELKSLGGLRSFSIVLAIFIHRTASHGHRQRYRLSPTCGSLPVTRFERTLERFIQTHHVIR